MLWFLNLPPENLPVFDAVITDPPYGMDWDTNTGRFSGGKFRNHRMRYGLRIYGDREPFDPAPFLPLGRVVLWGYNHFAQRVPPGTTLIWIKKPANLYGSFLSDAELAWMSGGRGVYVKEYRWAGISRAGERGEFFHPTQKPVEIMKWCIDRVGPRAGLILDPFMGSGTTLRAAKDLGRRAIGIEIEERYAEIAAKRMLQEVLPL